MNSRNQRRASRARQSPLDVAKEYVRKGTDQAGFVVKTVSDAVGKGLFSEKAFTKGEFLVEYRGKLGRSEATEHDDQTFIFHFQHGKNKMCIDATSDLCMAKMVNDDWREPNCKVKKETVDGKPHLLLFAIRDILPGQELRYDYGKEDAPWRMQDADVELEEDEYDTGENGVEQDADVELEDDEDDTEDSGVEEGADEELEEDVDIEETDMKVSEMADPSYKDDDDASHEVADPSYKDDDDVSHISESEYDSDVSTEIPMPSVGQRKNGENATGGVQILTANNSHKRLWDKHHFCVYCEVSYAKLPRHMEAAHSSELEVAEILSLDKGSKERSRMWEILRNKGNHAHNVEVLTKGRGFIVPVKRPTNAIPVSWYLPCKQCLGYYIGSDMWKHLKVCPLTDVKKPQSKSLQSECALLLPMKGSNAAFREKVLGKMNRDEVSLVVRNDETIIQLGERIVGSVDDEAHLFQYVSQKMREVGRLLLTVRASNPELSSIKDCINPKHFDKIVSAVKVTAGYDVSTQTYTTPSLALKLGHSLRKCALLIKAEGIKSGDKDLQDRGEQFDELCSIDWAAAISTRALTTLSKRKWNKVSMMPLSEDVIKVQEHLCLQVTKLGQQLNDSPNIQDWSDLCQVALAQVILFNRRRSGEIERMGITDYDKKSVAHNDDVMKSLSKWEQKLCQTLTRVEIRGKRGRKVPVLFTEKNIQTIDMLLKTREKVGVLSTNTFLFARPATNTGYRGADCLRKFALSSGTKHPEHLTSTQLRKQVATMSQVLSLKGNELDVLAGFMGHDINIHREYYRLPESTLQTAKVSKILMLAEKGTIGDYVGKSLDEIEIDMEDVGSCDEEEQSSDDESDAVIKKKVPKESKEKKAKKSASKKTKKSAVRKTKQSAGKKTRKSGERRPWSPAEIAAVKSAFEQHVKLMKVPGKNEVINCQRKFPILYSRDWKSIKYRVYNNIQSHKKGANK